MNKSNIIRVLIVDDVYPMRVGITTVLEIEDDIECKAVGTFDAAVDVYQDYHPHVVLVDIKLPERNGIELITALRNLDPEAKIIAISAYLEIDGTDTVKEAIRAGAKGFLLKDYTIDGQDLPRKIRQVYAGGKIASSQIVEKLFDDLEQVTKSDDLTSRELEVLKLLEKGMSNRAIGNSLQISEHTVKYHVKGIMSKLGADSRHQAVYNAQKKKTTLKSSIAHSNTPTRRHR